MTILREESLSFAFSVAHSMQRRQYLLVIIHSLILVTVTTSLRAQTSQVVIPACRKEHVAVDDAPALVSFQKPTASCQNKSLIEEHFSTRAADLLPINRGSILTTETHALSRTTTESRQSSGGQGVEGAQNSSQSSGPPRPNGAPLELPLFGKEKKSFSPGLGSLIGEPTALQGPTRPKIVSPAVTRLSVISVAAHLQQMLATNQRMLLELRGDPKLVGFDLSYSNAPKSLPGVFSINVFDQSAQSPTFENGERQVNLPHSAPVWVDRLGGGVEYFQKLTPQLSTAVGLNYQLVSLRNGAFTSNLYSKDEFGNRLTVTSRGQDELLTLNLAGFYNTLDNLNYPTRGTKLRFGIDQSIPVGEANILLNRLSANFTQFIPLNLFGFNQGPRTLVLNLQTGTILGDVPSYEAYTLGGSNSVRGFAKGEVGTGSSFIQTTAEYRFPILAFRPFKKLPINVGGTLFVDYGSDLGTGNNVIGEPGIVRGKPGHGLGYGIGLRNRTPFGLLRIELGLNDRGGSELHVEFGDRF